MKRFINIRFMLLSFTAILLTALLCTLAYYRVFANEVMQDLKITTHMLADTENITSTKQIETYARDLSKEGIRLTLIDVNGNVVFDNVAPVSGLDNHKNRVEIADALKNGQGSSIRSSNTINQSNFYYAIRLPDGSVLRTARETSSIYSMFSHGFPYIIGIALAILGLCYIVSYWMTKRLVAPIETLAASMDHPQPINTYEELDPVISYIQTHHQATIDNANMRQEFTANISHELKTPLTAISGYAELIENGLTNEETTQAFAQKIHHNANRLLRLINDILRLSELDISHAEDLHYESIDLLSLANSCANMLELSCRKHQVSINVDGQPSLIQANPSMMEELIYNLCDNAIRYNRPQGHVWVHVQDKTITIQDDGIGIPKEQVPRIFERFYRVDKSRSKKTGGTGLGLAIVKHIVELHKASIHVESDENIGTTITVVFP